MAQITTTDQNTGRPILWDIIEVVEMGEATKAATGYTHYLGLRRPKGRKLYGTRATYKGGELFVYDTRPLPLGF